MFLTAKREPRSSNLSRGISGLILNYQIAFWPNFGDLRNSAKKMCTIDLDNFGHFLFNEFTCSRTFLKTNLFACPKDIFLSMVDLDLSEE